MYCSSCGRENQQDAMFCAFCGKKLMQYKTQDPFEISEAQENSAAEPLQDDRIFMRPDPSRLVTPLSDNPAQPGRSAQRVKHSGEPDAAQKVEQEKPDPAPRTEAEADAVKNPGASGTRPAAARGATRPVHETGTDSVGRKVPERRTPVTPRVKTDWEAPNTIVPKRVRKKQEDLFFEETDVQDDGVDEEEENWSRHIKSALAGLFLLAVLAGIFYLLVLPGGQKLRASMGFRVSARTYAALGDDYLKEGSVNRAADAYYDALRGDPDNYDYALAVAKTQEMTGDKDKALSAYAKCISLEPGRVEPYTAVAEIYRQMGETERQMNTLKVGYDRTGDVELFRAYEALLRPQDQTNG